MTTLHPNASDSAVIHQISLTIYQMIVEVQQQHISHLAEKYRNLSWASPKVQESFIQVFTSELSKDFYPDLSRQKIDQYLRRVFSTDFFQSANFETLNQKIVPLIQSLMEGNQQDIRSTPENPDQTVPVAEINQNASNPRQTSSILTHQSSHAETPSGIAILLLDVENLKLDQTAESFLSQICTYPIQIKIAFANWRALGKQDSEFHQRGYQMIHVPPGENSADMKMTAIGSSIFLHYPNVREILVCSSDGDLTHLCHALSIHGLTVYAVKKQGEGLRVFNSMTKAVKDYNPQLAIEFPSLESVISCLKTVIREEQTKTKQTWMTLARVSSLFQEKMGIRIGQIVSHYNPAQPVKEFLMAYPKDFVVHKPSGQSTFFITIFDDLDIAKAPVLVEASSSKVLSAAKEAAPACAQTSPLSPVAAQPIQSPQELEKILVGLITQLLNDQASQAIRISTIATEFNKLYKTPITKVMKDLGIQNKLPAFLNTVKALKISQQGKDYSISLKSRR